MPLFKITAMLITHLSLINIKSLLTHVYESPFIHVNLIKEGKDICIKLKCNFTNKMRIGACICDKCFCIEKGTSFLKILSDPFNTISARQLKRKKDSMEQATSGEQFQVHTKFHY